MHSGLQRCCLGGDGLLHGRFRGDDFAGFVIEGFPAVLLLAGNDKDPLADIGFAEPGGVEGRDIDQAGLRGAEEAEVGDVPALSAAGATRRLAEDHDVLGYGSGNVHEQPDAVVVIGDDQLADRAGAEDHGVRRQVEHVPVDAEPGRVYALEELLARKWS